MGRSRRLNKAVSAAREYDPYTSEWLEHEFETYALLREELPIARVETRGRAERGDTGGSWLLTRYDDSCMILSDTETYSSQASSYPERPWIPQAIDPPAHTAYRRILNKWFTPDAMTAMEPHLEQFASELLDKMLEKDEFDFVADFADPFPTVIFCELFGFPLEDYAQLMDWKNTLMHSSDGHSRGRALALAKAEELGIELDADGGFPQDGLMQVFGNTGASIYAYFGELLEKRRREPQHDMISQLIASEVRRRTPADPGRIAGYPVSHVHGGPRHGGLGPGPDRQGLRRTAGEATRVHRTHGRSKRRLMLAIEELVRYHSIVLLPRRVTRAVEFEGVRFHTGRPGELPDHGGQPGPGAVRESRRADIRPGAEPAHGFRARPAPLPGPAPGAARAAHCPGAACTDGCRTTNCIPTGNPNCSAA